MPATFDATKAANVRWSTPIAGLGHSSPVAWGKKIFVSTAVSSAAKTTAKATTDGAKATGEATADVAKATGKATAKGAKEVADSKVGQATADGAKTTANATAKGATATASGAKKLGLGIAGAVTPDKKDEKKDEKK